MFISSFHLITLQQFILIFTVIGKFRCPDLTSVSYSIQICKMKDSNSTQPDLLLLIVPVFCSRRNREPPIVNRDPLLFDASPFREIGGKPIHLRQDNVPSSGGGSLIYTPEHNYTTTLHPKRPLPVPSPLVPTEDPNFERMQCRECNMAHEPPMTAHLVDPRIDPSLRSSFRSGAISPGTTVIGKHFYETPSFPIQQMARDGSRIHSADGIFRSQMEADEDGKNTRTNWEDLLRSITAVCAWWCTVGEWSFQSVCIEFLWIILNTLLINTMRMAEYLNWVPANLLYDSQLDNYSTQSWTSYIHLQIPMIWMGSQYNVALSKNHLYESFLLFSIILFTVSWAVIYKLDTYIFTKIKCHIGRLVIQSVIDHAIRETTAVERACIKWTTSGMSLMTR